jgi:hypothetical protein
LLLVHDFALTVKRCEAGHNLFSHKTKTETEILAGEEVKAAQLFFEVGKACARVQQALSRIGTQPITTHRSRRDIHGQIAGILLFMYKTTTTLAEVMADCVCDSGYTI